MNLEKARQESFDKLFETSQPIDPAIIQKFEQDLAADYENYLIENRAAAKKNAELSRTVCVA